MKISVIIDFERSGRWTQIISGREGWDCWVYDPWKYSGFTSDIKDVFHNQNNKFENVADTIVARCRRMSYEFALVLHSDNQLLAVVDHIQSVPLFYTESSGELRISSDPNKLTSEINPELDRNAVHEFMLVNYTTGASTLFSDVSQILAGQYLTCNEKKIDVFGYYDFWHSEPDNFSHHKAILELRETVLQIVNELLLKYPDHQKVLMLSGGLDSRLILWALDALEASNVLVCSYGKKYQRDVKWAKQFTSMIRFDWQFIPLNFKAIHNLFRSKDRRSYSPQTHLYSRVPFLQDYPALRYLQMRGLLSKPTMAVTGNSGDYVSGGHIQRNLTLGSELESVIQSILYKHFSIWNFDGIPISIRSNIIDKIRTELDKAPQENSNEVNLYEWWEWRERQSKFIVGSKRLYQWFDLPLFLPLWDKRIMQFFEKVPLEYRMRQKLYRMFCRTLVTRNGQSFFDSPSTKLGEAGSTGRLLRRAIEYFTNPRWGRYGPNEVEKITWTLQNVIGISPFSKLPTINGAQNSLLMWDLLQKHQIK